MEEGPARRRDLSMFPLQVRLRNRCGNAEEGPHPMRTFPRKFAFGAEIGGYRRSFASRRSPVRLRPLRSLACFARSRSAPLTKHPARQAVIRTAYAALFSLAYVDGVRCAPHRSTRTLGTTSPSASEGWVASEPGDERSCLPTRRAGSGGVAGLGSEIPAVRSTGPKTSPNVPHLRTPPRITDRFVNGLRHVHACYQSRRGPFLRLEAGLMVRVAGRRERTRNRHAPRTLLAPRGLGRRGRDGTMQTEESER